MTELFAIFDRKNKSVQDLFSVFTKYLQEIGTYLKQTEQNILVLVSFKFKLTRQNRRKMSATGQFRF